MSLVAVAPPDLTESEARKLTTSIQLLLDSAQSTLDRLELKVVEAYERRADLALGYESWADYADTEFKDKARYLPRSDRKEFAIKLSGHGLSTRAIAPIVGVTQRQVANDVQQVRSDFSPEPIVHPATGEVLPEGSTVSETNTIKVVTGLDGKSYTAPQKTPQRRALTEAAKDAGWELRKATERLQRIREDDRFSRNKEEVAAHIRGHLMFTVEVCQDLLDILNQPSEAN